MLPLKKIYIDSRHKTSDSVSDSDFKIELPYVLQMPANTVFFVTDVCIPHVWKTIETNYNDKLYVTTLSATTGLYVNSVVPIAAANYTNVTLGIALQLSLNAIIGTSTIFTVTATQGNNSLSIASQDANHPFRILTDIEVSKLTWDTSVDRSNIASANDILKNYATPSPMYLGDQFYFNCDFLDLQPINNVYITSPNLGSFDTLATFSNNVIKKVPVINDYGYMIIDQFMSNNDFLDCSKLMLKTLEFHLRDGRGRFINLHGSHVTFSIIFNKFNLET